MRHRAKDAPSHLRLVQAMPGVNAGDKHVELLQDSVGIVERAVFEDVALGAPEQANGDLPRHAGDLFPLRS